MRHQNFRGFSATPVLQLQNAIISRKSAATRVARHVQRDRGYPQSSATKGAEGGTSSQETLANSTCAKLNLRIEKRAQRLTFWVRRPPGGGGGLPCEGVVDEKSVPSLESLSSLVRREESRMSREFCRDVSDPGGDQKVCAEQGSCTFLVPYKSEDVSYQL